MASQVQIANMALQRIGAKSRISVLVPPDSDNAIRVMAIWDDIEKEVLEAIKPKFATVRTTLAQSTTTPVYGWGYAYALPADFVCFADEKENDPIVYAGDSTTFAGFTSEWLKAMSLFYPYVVENLDDDNLYLLSNWDSTSSGYNVYIRYIKYGASTVKWNPSFTTALTSRLAAELAITMTESSEKEKLMLARYEKEKREAISANRALDYVDDAGRQEWTNVRGLGARINTIFLR